MVKGNPVLGLRDKFKMLKGDLRDWNKEVFGYTEIVRKEFLNKLQVLDQKDDNNSLVDFEIEARLEISSQLQVINMRNEFLLQQKSRSQWFKHGDSNSKFFHAMWWAYIYSHSITLIIDYWTIIINKSIVLINILIIGFIWALTIIIVNFVVFRVNYPEETSTFVNGPNMQKSKLLLEPKQKKYSEEKKEKIKATRFQKQNWK